MQDGLESDPAAMSAAPFLESLFAGVIDVIGQLKSLSATLQVEGTDVTLSPFLRFQRNGGIQNTLKEMAPDTLTLLNELASPTFTNGALQGNPELMMEMSMFWLKILAQDSSPEQAETLAALTKQTKAFYEALGKEWAFSVNFGRSIIPDYLVIYELKDKQSAKAYMEEALLKQLQDSMALARNMIGDGAHLDMDKGAHQGETLMHNGVEIKSYVFPNFGSAFGTMPPEAAGLMPEAWHWYYALTDDHLFMVMGSPELLKTNLDNKTGIATVPSFSGEQNYEKLVTTLGLESNLFFAISPMTLVKSLLPIIAKSADPNGAATLQMMSGMFMNLPENYSIGFSAKAQDDGIGAKLLLTLGDFRQLIQIFAMMQGMGQMQ